MYQGQNNWLLEEREENNWNSTSGETLKNPKGMNMKRADYWDEEGWLLRWRGLIIEMKRADYWDERCF